MYRVEYELRRRLATVGLRGLQLSEVCTPTRRRGVDAEPEAFWTATGDAVHIRVYLYDFYVRVHTGYERTV